jgi:hypothetical protein
MDGGLGWGGVGGSSPPTAMIPIEIREKKEEEEEK